MANPPAPPPQRQRGWTYLGLLVAIAVLGIGLVAASEVWVTTAHRQRLIQLQWVGNQYVQAIGSYYESSPGGNKKYPRTLDDLLEDKRYASTRRHLRQVYVDPMTDAMDWELVTAPDGGVQGLKVPDTALAGAPNTNSNNRFVFAPLAN